MKYNILVVFVLSLGACLCAEQPAFDKHFKCKDGEIYKIFDDDHYFPMFFKCRSICKNFYEPLKNVFVKEKLFKFTGTETYENKLEERFSSLLAEITNMDPAFIVDLKYFYNEYDKASSKLYEKKISLDELTLQILRVVEAFTSNPNNFKGDKYKDVAALANKICKERLKPNKNNDPPTSPTGTGGLPPQAIGAIIASIVVLVIIVIVVIYLKMKK